MNQKECEVAAEHWARSLGYPNTHRAQRAPRRRWDPKKQQLIWASGKVDIFGADVIGFVAHKGWIIVQATTGSSSAVADRRRKLERAWPPNTAVFIVQAKKRRNVADARKVDQFFRVHVLRQDWDDAAKRVVYSWTVQPGAVPVPPEWLKKKGLEPEDSA